MLEYYAFWILLFLSLFGGLIVPLLMGASVWIERREHRIRLAGLSPGDWWIRQRRAAIDRERILGFSHRSLRWSDLIRVWPITAIVFVLLMPPANWAGSILDDFLFAVHPIICVGWWLNMRSRGIIHAEVYALSTWVMAYVAWSLSMLAPFELWNRGLGRSGRRLPIVPCRKIGNNERSGTDTMAPVPGVGNRLRVGRYLARTRRTTYCQSVGNRSRIDTVRLGRVEH